MDAMIEQAYKRKCFQGRGMIARCLDRVFFSGLCGICLYILSGSRILSLFLFAAALLTFILLAKKHWEKYRNKLIQNVSLTLKREDWLKQEADRIREGGGVVLYPTPDTDTLVGFCLNLGEGTSFHCFGGENRAMISQANEYGCGLTFHPWGEGAMPSQKQISKRITRDAPRRRGQPWKRLMQLPGNRYLMAGCVLLILAVFLRRAIYWRLLGSLCLLIGAFRRSLCLAAET